METKNSISSLSEGIFAPEYYRKFKCIADRCRHSCCIDWEICIDRETYEKYKKLPDIIPTVCDSEDGPCFSLCADGRCPHLNKNGLCNIIITHGEEFLSEICQNHPRFYNRINEKRIEAGLGIVCEEACRLILEANEPFSLYKVDNTDGYDFPDIEFDAIPKRNRIISLIEGSGGFDEKLKMIKAEFNIPELHTPHEWLDICLSLEIFDPEWKKYLLTIQKEKNFGSMEKIDRSFEKYYSRLLTYFVYRHVSTADSENNLRARLSFSILSANFIRFLFEAEEKPELCKLIEIARRYSAEIEYSEDNTADIIFELESSYTN